MLGKSFRLRHLVLTVVTAVALSAPGVRAHEPDAAGGLFRSHDGGANWSPINPGIYVSGALALAVSPRDPNHLLLATDSGVWRSRNGGRDWEIEAPNILTGPAFAAVFDAGGERALVAGASTLFRDDGDRWRVVPAPAGAAPARALVAASVPGRVYLSGRSGLYRSDDWGRAWVSVGGALQAEHVDLLVVPPGRPDDVYAVAGGSVWSSSDGARTWKRRSAEFADGGVEAVAVDPSNPARLWAVGAGQVMRSDHQGERWRPVGKAVPDGPATARALAVLGDVIMIATDRGVYRSSDAGERWEPPKESLPAHLGATVLVSDVRNPATFYAGFALAVYEDLRQRTPQGGSTSARPGLDIIAGGFALAVALVLGLITGVRHLVRMRHRARPVRDAEGAENRSISQVNR